MKRLDRIVWVETAKLVASPWATGGQTGRWRGVLKGWIGRTGRYEPLVVRRCGGGGRLEGCFEVVHGHGRLGVLRELGHERVACVVWEVSELDAMLYVATLNRVRGREVARRRVAVLREIARRRHEDAKKRGTTKDGEGEPPEGGTTNEVYAWMGERLLETGPVLQRVLGGTQVAVAAAPAVGGMREAFTVFLPADEKRRVVEALRKVDRNVARALVRVVEVCRQDEVNTKP